jgi:hypothetical protein
VISSKSSCGGTLALGARSRGSGAGGCGTGNSDITSGIVSPSNGSGAQGITAFFVPVAPSALET